ncbi:MAG: hypothetical protein JWM11_5341 [Planctomycetaceae bacterium]|nr:hypothetical protein [Planctomycetaceae bacterium]
MLWRLRRIPFSAKNAGGGPRTIQMQLVDVGGLNSNTASRQFIVQCSAGDLGPENGYLSGSFIVQMTAIITLLVLNGVGCHCAVRQTVSLNFVYTC